MIHDWIGYFAAVCTTGALVPQVVKAYRSRRTKDISYEMYVVSGIGVTAWLIYGWLVHDTPLFVANIVTLILVLAVLALKLKGGD